MPSKVVIGVIILFVSVIVAVGIWAVIKYGGGSSAPAQAPAPVAGYTTGVQNQANIATALNSIWKNCGDATQKYATFMDSKGLIIVPETASCPTGMSKIGNGPDSLPVGGFVMCVPTGKTVNDVLGAMPDEISKGIQTCGGIVRGDVTKNLAQERLQEPIGFSPKSSSGGEVNAKFAVMTPDQMMYAKQGEAQKSATDYAGMTQYKMQGQLAQPQGDAFKPAQMMYNKQGQMQEQLAQPQSDAFKPAQMMYNKQGQMQGQLAQPQSDAFKPVQFMKTFSS